MVGGGDYGPPHSRGDLVGADHAQGPSRQAPAEGLPDIPSMRLAWDSARSRLVDLLESLPEEDLARGIFHHPVGGWMTPGASLTFIHSHVHHHTYQFSRLL